MDDSSDMKTKMDTMHQGVVKIEKACFSVHVRGSEYKLLGYNDPDSSLLGLQDIHINAMSKDKAANKASSWTLSLNGCSRAQTFPNATFGWVNVKDVAIAHILAFEVPSASGRYCLVERVAHYSEVVKGLSDLYPTFQLPERCMDDKPYVPTYQVSKEKANSLGLEFTPLEVSIKETVESLKEKAFVDFCVCYP
ncbi:phenylacetaldehyde reductase-like [Mangifera indica]|uniref:phenylacetaldehyde reductase-like n=1 Tax=Mangifera indica TaxID=29780 RepID=UPI001CFC1FF0|nr:phenylacetaldehyde reductase-like [Mangifera indica]